MSLSRKAINFDLDTKELKKRFSDTRGAYASIKNFMLENGFEHRQYSGYASIKPMEDYDITILAEKLNAKFSWLSSCIQKFDVTDIGKQYSLSYIFNTNKTLAKTNKLLVSKELSQKTIKKTSKNLRIKDKGKNLGR